MVGQIGAYIHHKCSSPVVSIAWFPNELHLFPISDKTYPRYQCGRTTKWMKRITFIVLDPDDTGAEGGVQPFDRLFLFRVPDVCLLRDLDRLRGG
jgi:hypothetical protein